MNKVQAQELLIKEYPFLIDLNTKIEKQFVSLDGRVSNTFLVKSDSVGFEKFIAKSFVHNPESLEREWIILSLLLKKRAKAPQLLIPDHKPESFLLLEYISGISANEALQRGHDINNIFNRIGQTTGIVNSVELKTFGDILNPSDISWKEYQMERLNNSLLITEPLVDKNLFNKIQDIIKTVRYILDDESKGKPMLVHHDIYLESFLLEKETDDFILIDYGIAFGGRPLFDLAKFYIWDLSKYPNQKDNFLEAYSQYVNLPGNFNDVMKFYIIGESFDMIDFFHKIKDYKPRDDAIKVLKDLVNNDGAISKLLS